MTIDQFNNESVLPLPKYPEYSKMQGIKPHSYTFSFRYLVGDMGAIKKKLTYLSDGSKEVTYVNTPNKNILSKSTTGNKMRAVIK